MPKKMELAQKTTQPLSMNGLIDAISRTHRELLSQAGRAINLSVTLRNWTIGAYLFEYEQSGEDRARYGVRLMDVVSERLSSSGIKGIAPRSLRLCRQFYMTYPDIWQSLIAKSDARSSLNIWQAAITILRNLFHGAGKWQTQSAESASRVPSNNFFNHEIHEFHEKY